MKTLKEYLERNSFSIVKSLAELLSISDDEAKNFYSSLSVYDEGKVIDALKDGASEDLTDHVKALFSKFNNHVDEDQSSGDQAPTFTNANDRYEIKHNGTEYEIHDHKSNSVVDTAHSGHEAHNLITYWRAQARKEEVEEAATPKKDISQMAGKAKAGGYDMARELSKGQYQPKIVPNKKDKTNRQADKSNLKRGVYENSITPILFTENNQYKFKIVETSEVAEQAGIEAIFESTVMSSPLGGLSCIPGVGMSGLRQLSGIEMTADAPTQETDMAELESTDVNYVLAAISQMDDVSKACLISLLTSPETQQPQIDPEHIEMVKLALCDFGSALQNWVQESSGALDFLVPLIDTLWVKYNEF